MADNNSAIQPESGPLLSQIGGPGRGRVFEILQSKVTFGRAPECDVVLSGDGVSRLHAYLERDEDGVFCVYDNKSKNGVFVNGHLVQSARLGEGDVIQFGQFIFRFSPQQNPQQALESANASPPAFPPFPGASPKRGVNRRVLIYGGGILIIGLVYWISQQKTPANDKPSAASPASSSSPAASAFQPAPAPTWQSAPSGSDIPDLEDPTASVSQTPNGYDPLKDKGLKEAEQYFRRGQREYFDKNYHRAIDDFEAALAINRSHPVAGYYLAAAQHDAEAAAKLHYDTGIQYFDSLQYKRALYDFQQVVALMSHKPQDPIVKEAKEKADECRKKLDAAELLP